MKLKKKTKKLIALILLFLLPVVVFSHQAAVAEKNRINNPRIVYAKVLVNTPYIEPPLTNLEEQDKNTAIIKKIWRKDWRIGLALARCESGLRTEAVNLRTKDYGLFQISQIHSLDKGDLLNPVANTSFAYILFQEQKLQPWISSKSCWKEKI